MNSQLIEQIVGEVLAQLERGEQMNPNNAIPIAVSARHVHLTTEHVEVLFGKGYTLTQKAELSQPGQFAANETVVIAGPRGSIERVRILGPTRPNSQVEVSFTDAMKIGAKPPLRESGHIAGSAPITLIGPKGSVHLAEGLIIAQAHIHMNPAEAAQLHVRDGQFVVVEADGPRPISFRNVKVRVNERFRLEMHIDTDEANAGFITQGTIGRLVQSDTSSPVQQPIEKVQQVEERNQFEFTKKVLSNDEVRSIDAQEIVIANTTIVTALAKDTARELGKTITIRK